MNLSKKVEFIEKLCFIGLVTLQKAKEIVSLMTNLKELSVASFYDETIFEGNSLEKVFAYGGTMIRKNGPISKQIITTTESWQYNY